MISNTQALKGYSLDKGNNPRSLKNKLALWAVSKRHFSTHNLCILALFSGWSSSVLCVVMGVYMVYAQLPLDPTFKGRSLEIGTTTYCFSAGLEGNGDYNRRGHRIYNMSKGVQLLVTLGLSTTVNVLLDCLGYIHATTLRWALVRESRLKRNSNLRLFSCSKSSFPNKWHMNAIYLLGFITTFGAMTSVTLDAQVTGGCTLEGGTFTTYPTTSYPNGLDFNWVGITALGIGILLQTLVSTCAISKSALVATWSSDLLTNAKAYRGSHAFENVSTSLHRSNHTYLSFSESLFTMPVSSTNAESTSGTRDITPPSTHLRTPSPLARNICQISPSLPQKCQPSMLSILPNVCRIRYIIWAYLGVFAIWSGTLAAIDYKGDRLITTGWSSPVDQWKNFGKQFFLYADGDHLLLQDFIGLIIQICVQSFICFNLHCVELLFNVSRDEAVWRKATSIGIEINLSPIKSFVTNWQSLSLMVFKSLIQWVFGYAFRADTLITMDLLPLVTMTGLYLILGICTECLIRHRPKGAQPVTYGDIQLLSFFIDEWDHDVLFWGDKGEVTNGIRKAGTAGCRLSDIRLDVPYFGLESINEC